MEQYLYLFIVSGIVIIILLIILVMIFKNKKVQATFSTFSIFIGNSLKDNEKNISSFRVNVLYVNGMINPALVFGFVWVCTHEALSGYVMPYVGAIITYALTLAGFKNWGKSLELDSVIETTKINKKD